MFLGVLVPTLLLFFPLRRIRSNAKLAAVSFISILLVSQIWFGGMLSGLNELWLKTCIIYTFVLCAYLAFTWNRLGWGRIAPFVVMLIFIGSYVFSFIGNYTGQGYVADDCNGHLYHDRPSSLPQKDDIIKGLLYNQGGESESHFPGCLLPKARGCDYSRPRLKPLKAKSKDDSKPGADCSMQA